MIYLVPTTGKTSNYTQTVSLDGSDFILRFLWNERANHWFLTLRDAEGNDLVTGVKVVADVPFAVHDLTSGMPAGQLWTLDTTGRGLDPALRELGDRVVLMYCDEDSTL